MDKKELKWYVSPMEEIVLLDVQASLLAGSNPDNPFDGNTEEPEEV